LAKPTHTFTAVQCDSWLYCR